MSSNQTLLQKADLAIADLSANGGLLLPEQSATFIRKLIKQPVMIREARVVEMTSPSRKINKIGMGTRILRKATSGTALGAPSGTGLGGRAKPTTEQITLNTSEQIAEVRLPYDVLEDNIERAAAANNEPSNTGPGGLRQTILDLIAERASTDIEELALMADTAYTSGDADDQAYLAQFDGWLKNGMSNGNVVDNGSATVSKTLFKNGVKTLPKQYLRNLPQMRHYVSNNQEVEYRDTLANRPTALGDGMTTGELSAYAYGIPVKAVQLMPEDKGIFTQPLNLIFGIQRQISLEFDKDITARVYVIVLTVRLCFAIEQADALVVYRNLGS